jgi:UDP-glucose 4-epimerase
MPRSRCLVLGANGFIGSHLVDAYAQAGHEVIAFDRYTVAPKFKEHAKVTVLKGDVLNLADIDAALLGVNLLVHAFSATTPATSDLDPYTDITSNILNSVKIFDQSVKAGVEKIAFISSGGVIYGPLAEKRAAKEDDPASPVSPYGIGKLAIERYLAYFELQSQLQTITYRLSNPYGPRQVTKHNQGVVPAFYNEISEHRPIRLYGDGTSSRDYIFIEDAARIIATTSVMNNRHPVYNLGSGQQTSLNEVVASLEHALDTKAKVEYLDAPATFLQRAQISNSLITEEFGLTPSIDFSSGIAKTVTSYQNR